MHENIAVLNSRPCTATLTSGGTATLMPGEGGVFKPNFGFHGNHPNTKALKKTHNGELTLYMI